MNQKNLVAILGVAVVILLGTTIYFATINKTGQPVTLVQKVAQQPMQPIVPSTDETAGWQTYSNAEYGFEIKYPKEYEIVQDKSGWPHSIGLLLNKTYAQSYDLPIEIWNNEAEIRSERSATHMNDMAIKTLSNAKLITFWNQNQKKEMDQVVSTFKLTK